MKPRFILPDLKFARETLGETLSLVDRRQDLQVNFHPSNFKGEPGNKYIAYKGGRFLEQREAESFNAALADATTRYGLPDNLYPKTVYSSYYNIANTSIEEFPLYALKDRLLPDESRVIYDAKNEAFILPGTDDDSSTVLGRLGDFGAVFGSENGVIEEVFNQRHEIARDIRDINEALERYGGRSLKFNGEMIKIAEELSRRIAHYDPENIPLHKTLPPPVGLSVFDVLSKGYGGVVNLQEALLGEAFPAKFRESADVIIKEVDDLSYSKSDLEAPYIEEIRSLSPEQAENFLEGGDIYDGVYDDLVETDREDGHHDEIVGILYRDAIERAAGDMFSKRFGTDKDSIKRALYSFDELMELGVYVPASEGIGNGGYFDDVKEDILDRLYDIAQRAYPARIDPDYDMHEKFQMAIDISPVPRSEYDGPAGEDTYAGVMYYTSKRFSPSLLPIEKDGDGNQVIMPANYSDTAKNVMKILGIDPDTFTVWFNNTRDKAHDPSEARSKMVTEEKTQHYRVSARVGEEESKTVGPIEFDAEKISPEIIYEQFRPFFEDAKNHLSFITLEQEMNITHIYTDLPEEDWVEETYTRFQPIVYEGFIDELLRSDLMEQIEKNSVAGASTNTVINTEDYERFYKSFVQESENISGGFHAVTALSYMDVEDAKKINEAENGKLKIPHGTFIGFYNGVSGSGSVMGIDLPEKGIEIDLSEYRATVSVATEKRDGLYAIDDVYGFTGEAFLAGEEITFDAPPVKEQLEGMAQEWKKTQTKTPPPPSPHP